MRRPRHMVGFVPSPDGTTVHGNLGGLTLAGLTLGGLNLGGLNLGADDDGDDKKPFAGRPRRASSRRLQFLPASPPRRITGSCGGASITLQAARPCDEGKRASTGFTAQLNGPKRPHLLRQWRHNQRGA